MVPTGGRRKATIALFNMEAKSVITFPSGEMNLHGPGFYEITGSPGPVAERSLGSRSRPMAARAGASRRYRSQCCRFARRDSASRGSGTGKTDGVDGTKGAEESSSDRSLVTDISFRRLRHSIRLGCRSADSSLAPGCTGCDRF
jgi:hypothetical protein